MCVLSSLFGEQLLQDIWQPVEGSILVFRSLRLFDRPQETVTLFRGTDLVSDDSTLIGGIEVLNAVLAMEQWRNPWRRCVSDWKDDPDSLKDVLPYLAEMNLLQQMGCSFSQLRELPWVEVAETVAKNVCNQSCTLFAACLLNLPQLSEYIRRWRADSKLVDSVMGWQGRYETKVLCDANRPGAWLADFIHILMAIGKGDV